MKLLIREIKFDKEFEKPKQKMWVIDFIKFNGLSAVILKEDGGLFYIDISNVRVDVYNK